MIRALAAVLLAVALISMRFPSSPSSDVGRYMARTALVAPNNLRAINLLFHARHGSYRLSAAIEYPIGTPIPLKCNGIDGRALIVDEANAICAGRVDVPKGAAFYRREWVSGRARRIEGMAMAFTISGRAPIAFAAVLLLASASGAVGQDHGKAIAGEDTIGRPSQFVPLDSDVRVPPLAEPSSDLDRAKAVCERHKVIRDGIHMSFPLGDGDYEWAPGWGNCQLIAERMNQAQVNALAKAAAAEAEQDRQDHGLVDRVAAGK